MDKRITSIIAYATIIGIIIALVAGDREGAKFHINQALVIWLFGLLKYIPVIGWVINIFALVCWVIGILAAINQEEKRVPLIGNITLLK